MPSPRSRQRSRRHLARQSQCTCVSFHSFIYFLIIHYRYIDDAAEDDEEEEEEEEEEEVNANDLIDDDDESEAEEQVLIDSEEERNILKMVARYVCLPFRLCNHFH